VFIGELESSAFAQADIRGADERHIGQPTAQTSTRARQEHVIDVTLPVDVKVSLQREYDCNLARIELVPQEITCVLPNLLGNGFHATSVMGRSHQVKKDYGEILPQTAVTIDPSSSV
jgi:hypothetical protein